jgi:hypothetical protein
MFFLVVVALHVAPLACGAFPDAIGHVHAELNFPACFPVDAPVGDSSYGSFIGDDASRFDFPCDGGVVLSDFHGYLFERDSLPEGVLDDQTLVV